MNEFCLQGELDLTLFYKIEGCWVTVVDKIIFPAGGMVTDATISDETDRNVEMMKYGKLVKYR